MEGSSSNTIPLLCLTHRDLTEESISKYEVDNFDVSSVDKHHEFFQKLFERKNTFAALEGRAYIGGETSKLKKCLDEGNTWATTDKDHETITNTIHNVFHYPLRAPTSILGGDASDLGVRISKEVPDIDEKKVLVAKEVIMTLQAAMQGLHPPVYACGISLESNKVVCVVKKGIPFNTWLLSPMPNDMSTKEIKQSFWHQLQAASAFGLLMTDIKPANIIIDITCKQVLFIDLGADFTIAFPRHALAANLVRCILFVNCVLFLNSATFNPTAHMRYPGWSALKDVSADLEEFVKKTLPELSLDSSDEHDICKTLVKLVKGDGEQAACPDNAPGTEAQLAKHIVYMAENYARGTFVCVTTEPMLRQYVEAITKKLVEMSKPRKRTLVLD